MLTVYVSSTDGEIQAVSQGAEVKAEETVNAIERTPASATNNAAETTAFATSATADKVKVHRPMFSHHDST